MKTLIRTVLFSLAVFALEVAGHSFLFGFTIEPYLFNVLLSAVAAGSLLSLLTCLFKNTPRRIITGISLFFLGTVFSVILVYYQIFQSFFIWNTIGIAGDVVAFYREAWEAIKENWYIILTSFIPFLLYVIILRRFDVKSKKSAVIIPVVFMLLSIGALVFNLSSKNNQKYYINMHSDSTSTYYQYGVNTSSAIDIFQTIFGEPVPVDDDIPDPSTLGKADVRVTEERVIHKNVVEMDAEALIAASPNATIRELNEYFTSKKPTSKNDYTGMFEGKNLIFMTLEGFSYKAISEKYTPTLYKMLHGGFYFTNYYAGMWGGSTATGEYANITGNFYSSASCLNMSASRFNYSAMGNMFKRAGYNTFAYHDGEFNYYDRNLSHPAYGYNVWKALGNGLHLEYSSWPNSDYLMAKATLKEYIDSEKPFHTYYMTISGHTNYTFKGNAMASKHRDETADMNASDLVRGYVGTQMEVDLMCQYLIEELDKAGILEDTVIAMTCDHYPYGLKDPYLSELYGLPEDNIRGNLELYHNAFILWSGSMKEGIVIDEPCSMTDILPTLANLFGLDYDSRFMMGSDILAPEENIAIINTLHGAGGSWNWRTREGIYYSKKGVFEKDPNSTLADDEIDAYVARINSKVAGIRKYTPMVLDYDYYKYVFNKDGTAKYPISN